MCRAPPTTSESGKNASGQEAFGSKIRETPVVESPAASAADVTSTAGGAGTAAASEADKVGTSIAPTAEDDGGDLYTAGSLPTQTRRRSRREVHGRRMTCTGVFTSAPRGRWKSSPTAAMWRNSRRHHARLGVCYRYGSLAEPFKFLVLGRCVPQGLMAILLAC
jgi:hypothetical protein